MKAYINNSKPIEQSICPIKKGFVLLLRLLMKKDVSSQSQETISGTRNTTRFSNQQTLIFTLYPPVDLVLI